MEEIKIVPYTDAFRLRALELLQLLWSHLPKEEHSRLFDWRYRNKPGQSGPPIYLAMKGETVVGFKAFVEHPFLLGSNELIRTYTPADAIVHPDFRRRGVSRALSRALLAEAGQKSKGEGLIFNLSSNEESTKGNLRQGWQASNGRKRFVLLASPASYLRQKVLKSSPGAPDQRQADAGGLSYETTALPKAGEMARLAGACRNPRRLTGLRDADYFRWRYDFQPELYHFAYAHAGDEMLAYLVIRKVSHTQYLLWEYASKEAGDLKRLLSWHVTVRRIPFLRSWALSQSDIELLKSCGFLAPPSRLWRILGKEGLPVLVRPLSAQAMEQGFFLGGRDIRDMDNWQLFLSDRH